MKPAVVVLTKGLGLGGAERQIASSVPFWDRGSFDYSVAYVLPHKDHFVAAIEEHGVPVTCIGSRRLSLASAATRLRSLVDRSRPGLIHAHLPSTGILARLLGGVPVVYTEHNIVDSYRKATRLANRMTYSRNAATIAVSGAVADSITGYGGPSPTVVANGVDVAVSSEQAARAREELGIGSDVPLVVHVGNIRPGKGQHNLVAAAAIVLDKHPDTLVVSLGSEKYPGSLDELRADVRSRGLEGSVRFLGSRGDATSFTAAADVFANPSDVEGLPVAVLEAMALGTPVVATAVGGVPSIVVDGKTGSLVPPGEPKELARAIIELLDDPAGALRLAAAAGERIRSDFTMTSVVANNESIYRSVLHG